MKRRPRLHVVTGIDAMRTLRAELLALAEAAATEPLSLQLLCLVEPKMTEARIVGEWALLVRVLRPELARRLGVRVVFADGGSRTLGKVPESVAASLCRDAPAERRSGLRLPAPDYSFVLLKLLVYAWLTRKGPVTTRWLVDTAGCSYPTVASAVKRLGRIVARQSDRRLELRDFPRDEWSRLLVATDRTRSTLRFADRSGQPRSAASLAARLLELRPAGVAVAGVLGARHHQPQLDLMGLPRLDVSVHSPGRWPDISFVRRLDPALEATSDPQEPARLVVHFVRHAESLFVANGDRVPWADPVECLLDLHEARLEAQAAEFVATLRERPRGAV